MNVIILFLDFPYQIFPQKVKKAQKYRTKTTISSAAKYLGH
jgi:hypothetical protein